MSLPAVRPASVEAAHRVGIRTGKQDFCALGKRQDVAFVLQQHFRFFGSLKSSGSKLLRTELIVFLDVPVRMVEQTQAILQAQYTGYGIIDAAHRYLAFLNQFLQVVAEAHFVRHHRHVDTGIDGNLDGLLLGCCNVVARTQVIDVRPVGHDHAVPVQVFLQPFGQQFTVGMERHAVVYARVYHHRQGSGSYSSQERSKMLFAQIRTGNRRRCTVLARYGNAVTHVVLHAGSHVVFTDMVRVASLKALDRLDTHLSIYIAVFTVILPHTRPARVTSQVDYRCIRPGYAAGLRFVSGNLGTTTHQFTVERCSHIHALREHGSIECVGRSVNLVDTVDTRNTDFLHRFILNLLDGFSPFFFFLCHT